MRPVHDPADKGACARQVLLVCAGAAAYPVFFFLSRVPRRHEGFGWRGGRVFLFDGGVDQRDSREQLLVSSLLNKPGPTNDGVVGGWVNKRWNAGGGGGGGVRGD